MTLTSDAMAQPAPAAPRPRFGAATPGLPPPVWANDQPPPARHRSWLRWLVAAAVALVLLVVGVVIGRLTAPTSGDPVVVITRPVAAGLPVTAVDVRVMKLADAPTGHLTTTAGLTGRVARVPLQVGQVVRTSLLTAAGTAPTASASTVGIAITAGHGPALPLEVGDRVAVIDVPADNGDKPVPPRTLVPRATVVAVTTAHDGTETVSVRVPVAAQVAVAASAAAGQATVILVS